MFVGNRRLAGAHKRMGERIRLFVAVGLPDSVKTELGSLIQALKAADVDGVRPVRPEGIHLTLKFLGDVDGNRVDAIVEALSSAAAGHSPFRLGLGEPGAFPSLRKPRVLWVGVDGDMEALASLQSDVEGALETVGFARDSQAYSPHLTLARIHRGAQPSSARRAADILSTATIQRGAEIPVECISLMRTELHPDGAIHQRLVSMPLKDGYRSHI